jgi:hypothetical protein
MLHFDLCRKIQKGEVWQKKIVGKFKNVVANQEEQKRMNSGYALRRWRKRGMGSMTAGTVGDAVGRLLGHSVEVKCKGHSLVNMGPAKIVHFIGVSKKKKAKISVCFPRLRNNYENKRLYLV